MLVTGKYDIYLKNYKSGVWTAYFTTEQVMPTAIDEQGQAVLNGQAMPKRMTFLRSRAAEQIASVTVNATVTPENATVKSSEWSANWANANSEWATDKDIADYLTVTSDGLKATLECLQPFGEQITLGITVTDIRDNAKTATTTVDFMKRNTFQSVSYKASEATTEVSTEINVNGYYVTGSFAEWTPNLNNEMKQIDDADNGWSQYKATVTLNANDQIKVIKGNGTKYFDGWELWSGTADYAHVNKETEGYGNLVIDKAGKYDITFKSDKSNEQSHQISISPHTETLNTYSFGESYTLTSDDGNITLKFKGLNIAQSVGTVGSVPQNYKCSIGYTSEFVTAFAVNTTALTAEQLATTEKNVTLDGETDISLFNLPPEFVTKYINGEYSFDGNVMYIEFTAIDGTVSGSNKIYFAFDFTQGISGVEISAPIVF